jgi:DNA mismatch repair ATPase MutS
MTWRWLGSPKNSATRRQYHFEDQILNGKMSFDYRLRPGVVQKSNALELMRSVGLDVTGETGT